MKHFFFSLKEQQAEIPIRTSGKREKLVLSLSATFPLKIFLLMQLFASKMLSWI